MDEQTKYAALQNWFLSPQGQTIANACAAELHSIQPELRGKRLLQLGICGNNPWLEHLHFQNQWFISPILSLEAKAVDASITALPIDRNSIDCVVAPLTIELCAQGKNPLDEMDRVLKSMGHIVFFGINPWSFWGGAVRWGALSDFATTTQSALSLKLALLARGYRQCSLSSFYYIPPCKHKVWADKLEFLNQMGKMVWPFPAGFYCLIMQKYDAGQHIIPCDLRYPFNLARI